MFSRSQESSDIYESENFGRQLPFSNLHNSAEANNSGSQGSLVGVLDNNRFSLQTNVNESSGECIQAENARMAQKPTEEKSIRMFNLNEVFGLLPDFSGNSYENFEHFAKLAQQIKHIFKINDDIMKLIFLKHLKGNAQIWSMSQTDLMKMDLQEWFKKMEDIFSVKTSSIELHKQLESRKWRFGESFGEYCSEKQILALPLQLHESSLIEYLIEGIPDLQLRNQARIRNFSKVADIKNAFAFIKIHQRTNSSSSIICYNCR